jgi:pimeloyl-ACP methyl ester carboxylesterase
MPDVEIAGATLHCEVAGTGAPILLIPGLGLDHTYYRFGVPLLARRMQVLAVDPRGIGRSTKSPPPYSVESWADDFAGMIDKLGCGPIHGRWGAPSRSRAAQRHPGRIEARSSAASASMPSFSMSLSRSRKLSSVARSS